MDCCGKKLMLGENTLVMGILNVTPDSFFDGGYYLKKNKALERAMQMAEEGADIIDIGAQSTRPGYTAVSVQQQMERLLPIVKLISDNLTIPISIDTSQAQVAAAMLEAGANIINDQWALKADRNMARVIAQSGAPVILMHNRKDTNYNEFILDVISDLKNDVESAVNEGINREKIIIDPGIGFAKTAEQNLQIINQLEKFLELRLPILIGVSRKSFIGKVLNLPPDERLEGTLAAVAVSVLKGAGIIRVHDIKETIRAVKMIEAIKKSSEEGYI